MRVFEIQMSYQPKDVKYKKNVWIIVATTDAGRAVELTRKAYPDGEIWSVNQRGHWALQRIIVDPDCPQQTKEE